MSACVAHLVCGTTTKLSLITIPNLCWIVCMNTTTINPEKITMLENLQQEEGVQGEKDILGGGGLLDSDIYPFNVDLVYMMKSQGGATGIVVHMSNPNGQNHRETLWAASGDTKGNKNYYEMNGEKRYLPGFLLADSLSKLITGKPIAQSTLEEKVVKLYNPEEKKELPTKVQVFTDITGGQIFAGLIKQTVDKTEKNENTGAYEATGETRDENVIDKFFRAPDMLTMPEIQAGEEEPVFYDKWLEKNKGQVRNRAKGASGNAAKSGAPAQASKPAGQANKQTNSLFSKN